MRRALNMPGGPRGQRGEATIPETQEVKPGRCWDEPEARPGTSGLDRLPRSHPPQMNADVSLSRACL